MFKKTKGAQRAKHQTFETEKDEDLSNDSNDEVNPDSEIENSSDDETEKPDIELEEAEEQIKSIPFSQLTELKKNGAVPFKPRADVKKESLKRERKDGESKKSKNV